MNKKAYEQIQKYCSEKSFMLEPEKDYVLKKFLVTYYEAIDNHEQAHGKKINEDEKEKILYTLLTEEQFNSHADSAEKYYNEFKDKLEIKFEKAHKKQGIIKSIGVSIAANFIYSLILIAAFFVANDYIADWMTKIISGE